MNPTRPDPVGQDLELTLVVPEPAAETPTDRENAHWAWNIEPSVLERTWVWPSNRNGEPS
jgi:hypothetical protein